MTIDTFSSPRVVCRPALPCDTPDVKEFCKFIWDGRDYVQYAWDEWLCDPNGFLAAAEYAGQAVGLAKVTLLSPGQWWLEHGDGILRLMTSSQRLQVHHLCERLGYAKIGEALAPPLPESIKAFQPL